MYKAGFNSGVLEVFETFTSHKTNMKINDQGHWATIFYKSQVINFFISPIIQIKPEAN